VAGPATPRTESGSESVSGSDGLTAAQVLGGGFPGSLPEFLLEITATADSVTLAATVEVAHGPCLDSVTATVEFYTYDALGNVRLVSGEAGDGLTAPWRIPPRRSGHP
jgi:hypothetical protein